MSKKKTLAERGAGKQSKPKAKAGAASPQKAPKQPKSEKAAKTDRPTRTRAAVAQANGPARSYLYTQKLADEICRRLANGESLKSIARTPGFPSEATIREWSLDVAHPFAVPYARAREAGYHKLAEELLEISDDSSRDLIEHETRDGGTVLTVNHEHIQRARLRVDTRKWILSKMLPKVYGDKFQVGGEGGGPLTFKLIPGDEKL